MTDIISIDMLKKAVRIIKKQKENLSCNCPKIKPTLISCYCDKHGIIWTSQRDIDYIKRLMK
jgi:hypothetical protein